MLTGKVVKVDELNRQIVTEITINAVRQEVPLHYTFNDGLLRAAGTIDLADFDALGALISLNSACYSEHEGKTWQDVAIGFEVPVIKECR